MLLPNLGHLGAGLANDAADELVGHGHLVGLVGTGRPTLTRKQGEGCTHKSNSLGAILRRRIKTEEKAKVVASALGGRIYSIPCRTRMI